MPQSLVAVHLAEDFDPSRAQRFSTMSKCSTTSWRLRVSGSSLAAWARTAACRAPVEVRPVFFHVPEDRECAQRCFLCGTVFRKSEKKETA